MLSKSLVEVWKQASMPDPLGLRFSKIPEWFLCKLKFENLVWWPWERTPQILESRKGKWLRALLLCSEICYCVCTETVLPMGCPQPGTQQWPKQTHSWGMRPSSDGRLGLLGSQRSCWTFLRFTASKSLRTVTAAMKLKDAAWKKSDDKPRRHIKKQISLCRQSFV